MNKAHKIRTLTGVHAQLSTLDLGPKLEAERDRLSDGLLRLSEKVEKTPEDKLSTQY